MYKTLGNQWATSIPAFVMLGRLPIPFLFSKYGGKIRSGSKYASEAERALGMIQRAQVNATLNESNGSDERRKEHV